MGHPHDENYVGLNNIFGVFLRFDNFYIIASNYMGMGGSIAALLELVT